MRSQFTRRVVLSISASLLVSLWAINHLESEGNPVAADDPSVEKASAGVVRPATKQEARSRALLIHELTQGALQVMHRDFFNEENPHAIPSASLEDVFRELARSHGVELSWLNVQTDVVNVDHEPSGEFEQRAAKKLASGSPFVESSDDDRYQFAGPIRLASQCLKCHVKRRTSTEDRVAGLVIRMTY